MKNFSLLFIILAGCTNATDSHNNITFLTQTGKSSESMQAQLFGRLIRDEGCLKIEEYTVVWPYGFTYSVKDSSFLIYNDRGELMARTGDSIYISGGEVKPVFREDQKRISSQLPGDRCKAPFWVVGEEIKILE